MKANMLLVNRIVFAFVALASFQVSAIATTPVPKVIGPIPVTAQSYPFGAASHTLVPQDLKSLGYVEEEFLISGTARVYDWPALGPASVRVADAPYTTRVLVRRPINRSKFRFDAAWHNLVDWVRKGIPAPHAEPIRVENGKAVVDDFGNVIGGVRSPFLDVPTSTWSGTSTGESFCFIAGNEKKLDPTRIKQLYPDHRAYERKVTANVEKLVKERWITRADGTALITEAERAIVP